MVDSSYRFQPHEPTQQAVQRIASGCLNAALSELALQDGQGRAVHEARKRLKETRAVLALARRALGKHVYRRENSQLRKAARELTEAREAAARVGCVDMLLERFADQVAGKSFQSIRSRILEERDRAIEQAAQSAELAEAKTALSAAQERLASLELSRQGWPAISPGLRRGYARARRAMQRAYARPTPERFHEWRKRAKRHYYHLELLDVLPASEVASQRRKELKLLSEWLGDDHDLAELDRYLARNESELEAIAVALLRTLAQNRSNELRARAGDLGKRLFAEKPKAFRRSLRGELEPELTVAPGVQKARAKTGRGVKKAAVADGQAAAEPARRRQAR
jgi:hypothetical protein